MSRNLPLLAFGAWFVVQKACWSAPTRVHDELRVQRIVLVDEHGQEVGRWTAEQLRVGDGKGTSAILSTSGSSSLELTRGESLAVLSAGPETASLTLRATETASASLVASPADVRQVLRHEQSLWSHSASALGVFGSAADGPVERWSTVSGSSP